MPLPLLPDVNRMRNGIEIYPISKRFPSTQALAHATRGYSGPWFDFCMFCVGGSGKRPTGKVHY